MNAKTFLPCIAAFTLSATLSSCVSSAYDYQGGYYDNGGPYPPRATYQSTRNVVLPLAALAGAAYLLHDAGKHHGGYHGGHGHGHHRGGSNFGISTTYGYPGYGW